jgi:hypothetical protein
VLAVLDGTPATTREITQAVPDVPGGDFWVRLLAVTGRLHIRWDARTVHVLPADPPPVDDEEARMELARRFLRWYGPAHARQLAKWAGLGRSDAEETWRRLGGELIPVSLAGTREAAGSKVVAGQPRCLLATDEDALRGADPAAGRVEGVRFLPPGDPFLHLDAGLVVPSPPPRVADREPEPGVSRRLLNSLTGRVLVDGEIAASWGRAAGRLAIAPWHPLAPAAREAVTAEVGTLAAALGRPITTRWLG